eukprot:GHUV01041992.1.p1 GENE.GHUV01041992.1~~GHUV01041992.1.p1  ORF type:complete len:143 (-),score=27.31 GHUV01041992.1:630-1058(-)
MEVTQQSTHQDFLSDMAQFLRAVDPHHLISAATEGFFVEDLHTLLHFYNPGNASRCSRSAAVALMHSMQRACLYRPGWTVLAHIIIKQARGNTETAVTSCTSRGGAVDAQCRFADKEIDLGNDLCNPDQTKLEYVVRGQRTT